MNELSNNDDLVQYQSMHVQLYSFKLNLGLRLHITAYFDELAHITAHLTISAYILVDQHIELTYY